MKSEPHVSSRCSTAAAEAGVVDVAEEAGIAPQASWRLQAGRPELQLTLRGQGVGWAQMSWKGRLSSFKGHMEVLDSSQESSWSASLLNELFDESLNFEANI